MGTRKHSHGVCAGIWRRITGAGCAQASTSGRPGTAGTVVERLPFRPDPLPEKRSRGGGTDGTLKRDRDRDRDRWIRNRVPDRCPDGMTASESLFPEALIPCCRGMSLLSVPPVPAVPPLAAQAIRASVGWNAVFRPVPGHRSGTLLHSTAERLRRNGSGGRGLRDCRGEWRRPSPCCRPP